jgi:D-hexose-6-phosphate mutarotase
VRDEVLVIASLNETFGIDGHVAFDAGRGGLLRAVVANDAAEAAVYLYGAHVVSYRPRGGDPVLWTSPLAEYRDGAAIRGGVPLVFPWFGPDPDGAGRPQHGFARTALWRVRGTRALADGSTELSFGLDDDARTRALWSHRFALELRVTVGTSLALALSVTNTGDAPFAAGAALHTYLAVDDIARASIGGLDGVDYIDKLDGNRRRRQDGAVRVAGEVDRVYLGTAGTCAVEESARRIVLSQSGSRSTVVWNPWETKAHAMRDFPDDGYRGMVCVEAVNTGDDTALVVPGGRHTLSQTITPVSHAS